MKKLLLSITSLFLAGTTFLNAQTDTVEISSFAFSPDTITVMEGTTVVWINKDGVTHTSTSGTVSGTTCNSDGTWNTGNLAQGQTGTHNFGVGSAGTYPYYCIPHCPSMTGAVIVQSPTSMKEDSKDLEFGKVYPNPFNNSMTIEAEINNSSPVTIQVYDVLGNVVIDKQQSQVQSGLQKFTINTSDLSEGSYVLKLTTKNQVTTKLINKQ